MDPRLLLPLLLLAVLGLHTQGSEPAADCCLKLGLKAIPNRIVKSYRIQTPESGCSVRAVVFTTYKDKNLCAPPDAPWVTDLMKKLDGKPQSLRRLRKQKGGNKSRGKQNRV
ncbi:C-C motif chemokine 19 [Alligator mississippiensis]|uniref:C-C motif chemokine 19 n=1 Tax=Alligator mississippiensis TaxID=8496 RepID=UPI0003D0B565|nr:C-C motif chemokine 19 [Alligator mississippiensis]